VYAILTGVLSSKLHTHGLSFSRAIAIVFLLNEIEQIFYYQEKYEQITGGASEGGHNVN